MPVPDTPPNPSFRGARPSRTGGAGSGAADKLGRQVRQLGIRLRDQGMTRITQLAETGKIQAASKLEEVAEVIESVAGPVEQSYGSTAAQYVRRASGKVQSVAGDLRTQTVEDLVNASRSAIGNNPGIAIGTAALLGFAAARIAKAGLGEQSENLKGGDQTIRAGATA